MHGFERRVRIMERLRETGQINIEQICGILGASYSTIHRDLGELESQGLVRRVRGGAVLSEPPSLRTHFDIRLNANVAQKEEIARKAAEVIQDDTAIFLDHSTTVSFLARELRTRGFRGLIVLTNSLAIPRIFSDKRGVQVILTGGIVDHEYRALHGRWVINSLQGVNLHQVFASCGAVSLDQGFMTHMPFIRETLGELFRLGVPVNVLVDSTKFHKIGTFQIAPLNPSLRIFTDRGIPKPLAAQFQNRGLTVVV